MSKGQVTKDAWEEEGVRGRQRSATSPVTGSGPGQTPAHIGVEHACPQRREDPQTPLGHFCPTQKGCQSQNSQDTRQRQNHPALGSPLASECSPS